MQVARRQIHENDQDLTCSIQYSRVPLCRRCHQQVIASRQEKPKQIIGRFGAAECWTGRGLPHHYYYSGKRASSSLDRSVAPRSQAWFGLRPRPAVHWISPEAFLEAGARIGVADDQRTGARSQLPVWKQEKVMHSRTA